jgi:hypothetical protein
MLPADEKQLWFKKLLRERTTKNEELQLVS